MSRSPLLFLLLAVCLLPGCIRHRLDFNATTNYSPPATLREALIISFPDDVLEDNYRIRVGAWWWAQYYNVPIAEACLSELRGRFGPVFREGITVTTNDTIDTLRAIETEETTAAAPRREGVVSSQLDQLLDEMGAARPDEDTAPGRDLSVRERQQQIFHDASMEALRNNPAKYLLRVNQAAYNFGGTRAQVLMRVQLIDRRTNVILINNKVYTGRSQTFRAHENDQTNLRDLTFLTRQALSQATGPMVRDVIQAIGAQ